MCVRVCQCVSASVYFCACVCVRSEDLIDENRGAFVFCCTGLRGSGPRGAGCETGLVSVDSTLQGLPGGGNKCSDE